MSIKRKLEIEFLTQVLSYEFGKNGNKLQSNSKIYKPFAFTNSRIDLNF